MGNIVPVDMLKDLVLKTRDRKRETRCDVFLKSKFTEKVKCVVPLYFLHLPEQCGEVNILYRYLRKQCMSNEMLNNLLTNSVVASVRERTIPKERPPLVAKLMPTFADRGVSYSQCGGLNNLLYFFNLISYIYLSWGHAVA
jgi:hypothetical protein